jgi:hypothetical protein
MTGSKGARKASEYIAARFKEAGLTPLGDKSTYFQEFEFPSGVELTPEKNRMVISSRGGSDARVLKLDEDYRPLSFTSNAQTKGAVLCTGYGLVVPEVAGKPKYDSYEGLNIQTRTSASASPTTAAPDTRPSLRWSGERPVFFW